MALNEEQEVGLLEAGGVCEAESRALQRRGRGMWGGDILGMEGCKGPGWGVRLGQKGVGKIGSWD